MADRNDILERVERERDLYLRLLRMGAVSAIEPLVREALQLVVEVTGALQAYVEIHDPNAEDGSGWSLANDCTTEELAEIRRRISRGVIAASLATGRTIETTSALTDDRFRERSSVQLGHIEAVLCTPIGADPPIGVVYLHGQRRDSAFPPDVREKVELLALHLAPLADRLLARRREERERDPTRVPRASLRSEAIAGRSDAVATMLRQVALFAPLDVPVSIRGAAGTGRRLLARVLHANSARAGKPLVERSCHSVTTEELHAALLEAGGGSLLLRDVDALPVASQSALVGFLETGRVRDAEHGEIASDARLLVTYDANAEGHPQGAGLRDDLLRRLETLCIRVPDLAERAGDVPDLARSFCAASCVAQRSPLLGISPRALRMLETWEWPGQVAQLQSAIQAAVERARSEGAREIEARHLGAHEGRAADRATPTFQDATREFQRELLARVLDETQWNVSAAARRLDLTRSHIYNLIHAFALTRASPRASD